MNEEVKDVLYCGYGEGPKYGGREFVSTGQGDFYVVKFNSVTRQKDLVGRIDLNPETCPVVKISDYGFLPSDFVDVPLNEFGLKEIAKCGHDVLMLTATDYFVNYNNGIPSLMLLPCVISGISGAWTDNNGLTCVPAYSLFSEADLVASVKYNNELLFRKVDEEKVVQLLAYSHVKTKKEKGIYPCTHLIGEQLKSDYSESYPKATDYDIEVYKEKLALAGVTRVSPDMYQQLPHFFTV